MTDNQWPSEVSDYYRNLSLGEGPRENITVMRDAARQTQRWKGIAASLAAACVLILSWAALSTQSPGPKQGTIEITAESDAPRYDLVAVRIHKDTCGKCKQMGNVFAELQHDLNGRQVLFVTLDLSNPVTTKQTQLLVDILEISKPLQGVGTGNIVLLAPDGRFLEQLDGTAGREYLANRIAMRL